MKDKLIKSIAQYLEISEGYSKSDIPYIIAPLDQHLDNFEYRGLLDDINNYNYSFIYSEDDLGQISIEIVFDRRNETYAPSYVYEINLTSYEKKTRYCNCKESNKGYDKRYGCCGHDCSWTSPGYNIYKIEYIGSEEFKGDEHDLWDYKDKYNKLKRTERP